MEETPAKFLIEKRKQTRRMRITIEKTCEKLRAFADDLPEDSSAVQLRRHGDRSSLKVVEEPTCAAQSFVLGPSHEVRIFFPARQPHLQHHKMAHVQYKFKKEKQLSNGTLQPYCNEKSRILNSTDVRISPHSCFLFTS